jgi:creatine kinase
MTSVEQLAAETAATYRNLHGMATATGSPEPEELLTMVEKIKAAEPGNRCTKYFDVKYYESLDPADRDDFWACIRTGVDNPDSGLGCYAMTPAHYQKFHPFFGKVIGDYHKSDPECKLVHVNDWDTTGIGDNGVLDLSKLGLKEELSMRVRVGRNLSSFNLPGAMDKTERIKFEMTMLGAFAKLMEMAQYGGSIYSISPDFGDAGPNPNLIDDDTYNKLVKSHIMFKDMDADPYLKSAGISSDWPYGRGCWVSTDKQKIIWFGEEDQLRIMVMKKGYLINEVFDELQEMLKVVESLDGIDFCRGQAVRLRHVVPFQSGHGHARLRPREAAQPHQGRHRQGRQGRRRPSRAVGARHGRRAHADRR